MARIKTYPIDTVITENDIVIGSDGENSSATRNYRMKAIKDYVVDGYISGGALQLKADWNSTEGASEILNKPEIQPVPTNVSDFVNDAGYLTAETPQVNIDWNSLSGASQILNKPAIPKVPTNVSDFVNDAGYLTAEAPQVNSDWDATSGVTEILNKPTNLSDFNNDAGYLTSVTPQVNSDWDAASGVSRILNKPTFKTINSQPITGSGNILLSGSGTTPPLQDVVNVNGNLMNSSMHLNNTAGVSTALFAGQVTTAKPDGSYVSQIPIGLIYANVEGSNALILSKNTIGDAEYHLPSKPTGVYTFAASVNNIEADSTGNITIPTGGGGIQALQSVLDIGNIASTSIYITSSNIGDFPIVSELSIGKLILKSAHSWYGVEQLASTEVNAYGVAVTRNTFTNAFHLHPQSDYGNNFLAPNKQGGTYILATTSDFKTINSESIVGEGNIVIPTGGGIASITGTAVDNTDPLNPIISFTETLQNLQSVLDAGNTANKSIVITNVIGEVRVATDANTYTALQGDGQVISRGNGKFVTMQGHNGSVSFGDGDGALSTMLKQQSNIGGVFTALLPAVDSKVLATSVNGVYANDSGNITLVTGGGGAAYIEKTKVEMDALISANGLVPNTLYKISRVHPTLYDDGTTSGTTIYLTAFTTNILSKEGHGEFYNPKYNQAIAGFGIWANDATYAIGDKAIWGGYSWTNVNGLVGAKVNILNLNAEWTKDTYELTNYNKAIDIIAYDYPNDWINRRYESQHGNNVEYSFQDKGYNGWSYSAISVFMFGNGFVYELYRGIANNSVTGGSYFECVDFRGDDIYNNTLKTGGYIKDNLMTGWFFLENNFLSTWSNISHNTIINGGIYNNIIADDSQIRYNTMTDSRIGYNTLTSNSFILNNILSSSEVSRNIVTNGSISNNTFISYSFIEYNTVSFGTMESNNLTNSRIERNIVNLGKIDGNTLIANSYIYYNSFTNSSLTGTTLNISRFTDNTLNMSTIAFQTAIISKTVKNLIMDYANVYTNFDTATIIFHTYPRTLYNRPDGTPKLRYYNNSDLLVIADITD